MLLAYPFRLFFLAAGGYAIAAMTVWLCLLAGHVTWPGPVALGVWHGHEMVFGYAMAVIAGFILTAVSNWTATPPWRGMPLAALGALWLAGRLAFDLAPWLPPVLVTVVDMAFVPALAAMLAVPLLASGNRRQFAIVGTLAMLALANLAIHLEIQGFLPGGGELGVIVGVDLLVLLISILGGRVIPMFTGNALRMREPAVAPVTRPWLEPLALLSLVAVTGFDAVGLSGPFAGIAALVAAGLHGLRLAGWRGVWVLDQPILWVLHLAYGWLVLGLALKGLAVLVPPLPASAALHALTTGAIGTMTIGIMSRVALAHTGRPLVVAPLTVWAYLAVTAAALVRVLVPITQPDLIGPAMTVAGALWILAFCLFMISYASMLIRPRVDGRQG